MYNIPKRPEPVFFFLQDWIVGGGLPDVDRPLKDLHVLVHSQTSEPCPSRRTGPVEDEERWLNFLVHMKVAKTQLGNPLADLQF